MEITALIMAGGRGERFWPRSRKNLPKQFLSLTDDGKTMIQLTVERILSMVPIKMRTTSSLSENSFLMSRRKIFSVSRPRGIRLPALVLAQST